MEEEYLLKESSVMENLIHDTMELILASLGDMFARRVYFL
jgi:hypothetical protein